LEKERLELAESPELELKELQQIYVKRGLDADLALRVAEQLTASDALTTHLRDELGISAMHAARPIQAAFASAGSFAVGAALPLLAVVVAPPSGVGVLVTVTSLAFLALLGGVAARAGGAEPLRGALRVTFWGALAMAITAAVGRLVGTVV
jgi:VIT1/CCC1 family predicted Fe2+/Mn2+ transporter